jgi:hypothetical protein
VSEKCVKCGKTVFQAERLAVDGRGSDGPRVFHAACFRCCACSCKLALHNFEMSADGTMVSDGRPSYIATMHVLIATMCGCYSNDVEHGRGDHEFGSHAPAPGHLSLGFGVPGLTWITRPRAGTLTWTVLIRSFAAHISHRPVQGVLAAHAHTPWLVQRA